MFKDLLLQRDFKDLVLQRWMHTTNNNPGPLAAGKPSLHDEGINNGICAYSSRSCCNGCGSLYLSLIHI